MSAAQPVTTRPPPVADAGEPETDDAGGLDRWLVVAAVVAGVALRGAALTGTLGRTDSDEVLSGLLARHLGTDGWPVFLWGQSYGGTIELGPLALSTALFGSTAAGLRLPVALLAAGNCVLIWRIARRLLPTRPAQVAGLLAWLGPPATV